MLAPQPAAVRPRVILPDGSATLLVDEVATWLDEGRRGLIGIYGPQGSGRTTALEHLAHAFPLHHRLLLVDGSPLEVMHETLYKLVICTAPVNYKPCELWRIAPWTRDDLIEYLLSVHPAQCGAVMSRLASEPVDLGGRPELWCAALDELAADASLPDVAAALRRALARAVPSAAGLKAACHGSLRIVCGDSSEYFEDSILRKNRKIGRAGIRLLRHPAVRLLAAADRLALELCEHRRWPEGCEKPPRPLLEEVARRIAGDRRGLQTLLGFIQGQNVLRQPAAASILHALGTGWRPDAITPRNLKGAYLGGAQWSKLTAARCDLSRADFSGADLSEADLQKVTADGANFSQANMHGARLTEFSAFNASFAAADLSFVRTTSADFRGADFRSARLDGALLNRAKLFSADLRGARFVRASLINAALIDARIAGADFTSADLSAARLTRLVLREAEFRGAKFDDADMRECNLEGMHLPGASFLGANLRDALLTDTRIPGGQFRDADLRGAGLADVQWENADLRDADFRNCTFHLGSTRCGLLDSPLASEGTRTGFYTDEFEEQHYRSPEEIRKANLRGANLIGADLEGTDFYLVDLRDALYTPDQEAHLRRTGAILEVRT